jgi:5-methylcytosine-specific restriction endonuclease McrA
MLLPKPRPVALDKHQRRVARESLYKRNSRLARERDRHRCRLCDSDFSLETHHVIPRSLAGKNVRDTVPNLVTLCRSCHENVTRHVVRLYVTAEEGANGPMRAFQWSEREVGWVDVKVRRFA